MIGQMFQFILRVPCIFLTEQTRPLYKYFLICSVLGGGLPGNPAPGLPRRCGFLSVYFIVPSLL